MAAALSELAEHRAVPVKLTVSAVGVPADVAAVAYFVVAEALSNVAKYAEARTVTVTAEVRDARLAIQVSDDGVAALIPKRDRACAALPTEWQRSTALCNSTVQSAPARGWPPRFLSTARRTSRSADFSQLSFEEESKTRLVAFRFSDLESKRFAVERPGQFPSP